MITLQLLPDGNALITGHTGGAMPGCTRSHEVRYGGSEAFVLLVGEGTARGGGRERAREPERGPDRWTECGKRVGTQARAAAGTKVGVWAERERET